MSGISYLKKYLIFKEIILSQFIFYHIRYIIRKIEFTHRLLLLFTDLYP